jgi:hypothetical protein
VHLRRSGRAVCWASVVSLPERNREVLASTARSGAHELATRWVTAQRRQSRSARSDIRLELPFTTVRSAAQERRPERSAACSGRTTGLWCNAIGRGRVGGIANRPEIEVDAVLVGEAGLACNRSTRRVDVYGVGVADRIISGARTLRLVSTVVRTETPRGARKALPGKVTRRAALR